MQEAGTDYTYKAPPGKTYLLVNLDIENNGYDTFKVYSSDVKVIINGAKYSSAMVTYSLDNSLPITELLDGGKISGSVAFEIPAIDSYANASLAYESMFKTYNINWIKK